MINSNRHFAGRRPKDDDDDDDVFNPDAFLLGDNDKSESQVSNEFGLPKFTNETAPAQKQPETNADDAAFMQRSNTQFNMKSQFFEPLPLDE